jgi:hypothetical protein
MVRVASLRRRWNEWWFAEEPPHALALLRICFGGFLLFYWGLKLPYADLLFSDRGLLLPLIPAADFGFFEPLFSPSAGMAFSTVSLLCLSLFLFTLGVGMRWTGLLAFILYSYEWFLALHQFSTSFDRLFLFVLLILLCSGADRTFSYAMQRKHGSWFAWEPASVLPLRLIAVQIAATYFGVGWQKLWLPAWKGGEILAYSFVGPWGSAPAFALVRVNLPMWFYDGLVWVVKFFEFLLAVGLFVRRWQWYFFLGGAVFHIFIAVFMEIWWFLILIPAYVVFLPPREVYAYLRARCPGKIR